jgi:hypothetical protein
MRGLDGLSCWLNTSVVVMKRMQAGLPSTRVRRPSTHRATLRSYRDAENRPKPARAYLGVLARNTGSVPKVSFDVTINLRGRNPESSPNLDCANFSGGDEGVRFGSSHRECEGHLLRREERPFRPRGVSSLNLRHANQVASFARPCDFCRAICHRVFAMQWMRAGKWTVERRRRPRGVGVLRGGADALFAIPDVSETPTIRRTVRGLTPVSHLRTTQVSFLHKGGSWWETVGRPNGFESYDLDPSYARSYLATAKRIVDYWPEDRAFPDSPAHYVVSELLNLIVRFGPLASGPLTVSWSSEVPPEPLGVDLEGLLEDLYWWVSLFEHLDRAALERRPRLVGESGPGAVSERRVAALQLLERPPRNMRFVPAFTSEGRLTAKPLPRILSEYLWVYLATGVGAPVRGVCQFCLEEFSVL